MCLPNSNAEIHLRPSKFAPATLKIYQQNSTCYLLLPKSLLQIPTCSLTKSHLQNFTYNLPNSHLLSYIQLKNSHLQNSTCYLKNIYLYPNTHLQNSAFYIPYSIMQNPPATFQIPTCYIRNLTNGIPPANLQSPIFKNPTCRTPLATLKNYSYRTPPAKIPSPSCRNPPAIFQISTC